jgi:hypothetical protein
MLHVLKPKKKKASLQDPNLSTHYIISGFRVLRSNDVVDSAQLLEAMTSHLAADKLADPQALIAFEEVQRVGRKTKSPRVQDILRHMLLSVPRLGVESVIAVMEYLRANGGATVANLVKHINHAENLPREVQAFFGSRKSIGSGVFLSLRRTYSG